MKYEPETRTLQFASPEELESFHRELTALLREVTIAVSGATPDASQARERAREVLREFKVVTRILNAVRKGNPRAGAAPDPDPET